MCGIAGIVGKVNADVAERLIVALQSRGRDATGVGVVKGKSVYVYKTNVEAAHFVKLPMWSSARKRMKDSHVVLLHTRAATHGSPTNNDNNHPIYTDDSLIIHNGVVNVGKKYGNSYGETDTEQFLRAIEDNGGGIEGIQGAAKITSGWLAIAYQSLNDPYTILLYKDGSPLAVYEEDGTIIFCSEKKIIAQAIQKDEKDFKVRHLEAEYIYKLMYKSRRAKLKKTDYKAATKTYNYQNYQNYNNYGWVDDDGYMRYPMQTQSAAYTQQYIQSRRPAMTVDKLLEENQALKDWTAKYGDIIGWRWDGERKIQRRYNYSKKQYLDVQKAEELFDADKKWTDKDDLKELQRQLLRENAELDVQEIGGELAR